MFGTRNTACSAGMKAWTTHRKFAPERCVVLYGGRVKPWPIEHGETWRDLPGLDFGERAQVKIAGWVTRVAITHPRHR